MYVNAKNEQVNESRFFWQRVYTIDFCPHKNQFLNPFVTEKSPLFPLKLLEIITEIKLLNLSSYYFHCLLFYL